MTARQVYARSGAVKVPSGFAAMRPETPFAAPAEQYFAAQKILP